MTISSAPPFTERLRLVRLLTARGALKLRAGFAQPFLALSRWRARPPDRLLIAPQDIRTGDPTVADDIYGGYYAFGGKIVNAHGCSPFTLEPPSGEWARILYGFSWLRHLRAAESALARANARALVQEFIALRGRPDGGPAWEPDVVARRTLSWLSQSPMLLEGVDFDDYRRFIRVLARGYWLLRREAPNGLAGDVRLTSAIAMTAFALCTQGGAPSLKGATALLNEQLNRQILLDGGHIGRNPRMIVDLLFDLLPLRQAFAARGLSPTPELLNAIDRMMPALRMFRHGDGALALFNGMGVTAAESIAILLAYEDSRGLPIFNAPYSGYQRLEAGEALVLMDAGTPPPPVFSRSAHAGCLSFEYSRGPDRVVINCGAPGSLRADLRASARTSAAHSTLVVNDVSICAFGAHSGFQSWFGDEIVFGPTQVPVQREDTAQESKVIASHDAYLRRFGLIHQRTLTLTAASGALRGRDQLIAAEGVELSGVNYVLRFHLHPSVAATEIWDSFGALLQTASGETLIFEAGGRRVDIEESIYFAAIGGPRPTLQIVVSAAAALCPEVAWSFAPQGALAGNPQSV